jgi:signal transduction histidine kinase
MGSNRRGREHVMTFMDITSEAGTGAGRPQAESSLRFAVDHFPIAIWATDRHGVVTMSEGAGLSSLGVSSGQLVGQSLFDLYARHPTIPGFLQRALAGESFWYNVQVGEAAFDTWLAPVRDAAGEIVGLIGLSNDVSEVRKLQAQAIQNDRVVALGTLAASVAHEINNPLTYILGHLVILKESLDGLDRIARGLAEPARGELQDVVHRMRASLDPISAGTERVASITRELRTFSKPATGTAVIDVQSAVTSVLKLLGKELESHASLEVNLKKTLPIHGDTSRLVQVILNLVVNAMQALPAERKEANQIWVNTWEDKDMVVIEVADNGPGVPVQDRERIFEPFQTTRDIGHATGLGLFVSRNIVNAWAGWVTVDERPGGGARFRVSLPAAREAGSPEGLASTLRSAESSARAHVLIIDDEPMVASVLRAQLEGAGYRVTLITEAEQALERLTSGKSRFDLVYCDLMMKGLSGMDLAAELALRAPSQLEHVVFMTGGAFTQRARDFRSVHPDRCVDKPFDILAETAQRLETL